MCCFVLLEPTGYGSVRDQSGPTKLIGKEPLLAAFTPRSADTERPQDLEAG